MKWWLLYTWLLREKSMLFLHVLLLKTHIHVIRLPFRLKPCQSQLMPDLVSCILRLVLVVGIVLWNRHLFLQLALALCAQQPWPRLYSLLRLALPRLRPGPT